MLFQKYNPVSDEIMDATARIESHRQAQMETAFRRYSGEWPKALNPTKSDPKGEDNAKRNLSRRAVDIGASFLYGDGVEFEIDGEAENENDEWLDNVWNASHKSTLLLATGINAGIFGDCFLRVQMANALEGEAYPRIVNLDPMNMTVIWEPSDCLRVKEYRYQWNGIKDGKICAFRQRTQRVSHKQWLIIDEVSTQDSLQWHITQETTWNYATAPIFHAQNLIAPNSYYGRSDLEDDVLGINGEYNFLVSNHRRILRVHGHPKTWGSGFRAEEVDMCVDSLTILHSEEGKLQNLEMQSDLSASLETIRETKKEFFEAVNIPDVTMGKVDNIGQLSGLALKILYGPLLRVTKTKQTLHAEMLNGVNALLLEIGGKGEGHKVTCQWASPLPADDAADVTNASVKQSLGVSTDTILSELGYDPEIEKEKKSKEVDAQASLGKTLMDGFGQNGLTSPPGPPGGTQ